MMILSELPTQALAESIKENPDVGPAITGNLAMASTSDTPLYMLGDVNGNGIVDPNDATLIARYCADLDQLTEIQKLAADVNGNGVIDPNDATLIARYCTGLEDLPLPVPTGLICTSVTDRSVTLAWNHVAKVIAYEVLYNDVVLSATSGAITISGLEVDTEYSFTVRAVNEKSAGKLSPPLIVKTLQTSSSDNAEYTFDIVNDEEYTLAMTAKSVSSFDTTVFVVTYDSTQLSLVDFAAQTKEIDIRLGKIDGTDLEILSIDDGTVEFITSKSLPDGKAWSGPLTFLKFKALGDGKATIEFNKKTTELSEIQNSNIKELTESVMLDDDSSDTGITMLEKTDDETPIEDNEIISGNVTKDENDNSLNEPPNPEDVRNYSDDNDTFTEEVQENVFDDETEPYVDLSLASAALATDDILEIDVEYPSAAYVYCQGSNEIINLNTGSLTYEENIIKLPGRNGLDLDITVQYNSSTIDVGSIGTMPHLQLARGWTIKKDRINGMRLELANGSSYTMRSNGKTNGFYEYRLENYTLDDMTLKEATTSDKTAFRGSAYVLSFKDGKKEYFDSGGRLIVEADKNNNSIKYVYSGPDNSRLKTEITDSVGNVITMEHGREPGEINRYRTVFTLPDGKNIIYHEDGPRDSYPNQITKKENQLGEITRYYYTQKSSSYFNSIARCVHNDYITPYTNTQVVQDGTGSSEMLFLGAIWYPTGLRTNYTYHTKIGSYGDVGLVMYNVISSRYETIGNTVYNKETYTYSNNNYTGYPLTKKNTKQYFYADAKYKATSSSHYRYYDYNWRFRSDKSICTIK